MTGDREALVGVMREAAALVAASPVSRVHEKTTLDYVTDVDLQLDAFLTNALAELTPGVPVLSEERPIARGGRHVLDHRSARRHPQFDRRSAVQRGLCRPV